MFVFSSVSLSIQLFKLSGTWNVDNWNLEKQSFIIIKFKLTEMPR